MAPFDGFARIVRELTAARSEADVRRIAADAAPDGVPEEALGAAVDLALANVRLVDELGARNATLRAIFDNLLQSYVMLDRDLRVVEWNAMAQRYGRLVLGRDYQVGDDARELFRPTGNTARFEANANEGLAGRPVTSLSLTTGPHGGRMWFETCYTPVRSEDGEILGVAMSALDVTERELARAHERELAALLAETPDIVAMVDGRGEVLYLNRAGRERLGYGDTEPIPTGLTAYQPARERPRMADACRRAIRDGHWVGESVMLAREGTELPVSLLVVAHREHGELTHFGMVARDLTETKQLQQQLLRAQRTEAVGRLTQGVAHDFNNALTPILCSAGILRGRLATSDTRTMQELATIEEAARHAAALTRQLLAFSRQQLLDMRRLDLNAEISQAVALLRRTLSEDIELRVALAPDLPPVYADPGQILQVLMNLVINAAEATPGGGVIQLSTSTSIPGDDGPARVAIDVRDTGSGMDRATQAHIFEPFFTTKLGGERTGLGLSTCYGIVAQHGGAIEVLSAPGRGTTMTVLLPLGQPQAADHRNAVWRARATGGDETILVVDDDYRLLRVIQRILVDYGYRVLPASSPTEARRAAEDHDRLDLVVTDVVLPGITGGELYAQLAVDRPELAVLYVSGYAEQAPLARRVLRPDVHFLSKPFAAEQLARAVRHVLDGEPPTRM